MERSGLAIPSLRNCSSHSKLRNPFFHSKLCRCWRTYWCADQFLHHRKADSWASELTRWGKTQNPKKSKVEMKPKMVMILFYFFQNYKSSHIFVWKCKRIPMHRKFLISRICMQKSPRVKVLFEYKVYRNSHLWCRFRIQKSHLQEG